MGVKRIEINGQSYVDNPVWVRDGGVKRVEFVNQPVSVLLCRRFSSEYALLALSRW